MHLCMGRKVDRPMPCDCHVSLLSPAFPATSLCHGHTVQEMLYQCI